MWRRTIVVEMYEIKKSTKGGDETKSSRQYRENEMELD
jgi:hypothetical protein